MGLPASTRTLRTIVLGSTFTIVLAGRSLESAERADVKSLLDQGMYSFEEGDYDAAVAAFEKAFAMNPTSDAVLDFVDWVREYVVFAVEKGNPQGITSLDTACGKRIAVMSGGSAEKVIKEHSEKCVGGGKPAVAVQSYTDQPTSILAVRSKRSDAFFSSQAPLTYFVQQANGQLELAGVGQANGFKDIYQGAVVPKGSPLGEVLRDSFKILMDNGTYAEIMKKWGLENNMIKEPGINQGV